MRPFQNARDWLPGWRTLAVMICRHMVGFHSGVHSICGEAIPYLWDDNRAVMGKAQIFIADQQQDIHSAMRRSELLENSVSRAAQTMTATSASGTVFIRAAIQVRDVKLVKLDTDFKIVA